MRRDLTTFLMTGLVFIAFVASSSSFGEETAAAPPTTASRDDPPDPRNDRIPQTVRLPDGSLVEGDVDRSLVQLRDRLHALVAGPSQAGPVDVDPASEKDFRVPLDRPTAIDARIPLIRIEIRKLEKRLADARAEAIRRRGASNPSPTARSSGSPAIPKDLAEAVIESELRLDIARTRLAYLKAVSARLAAMPELARVALVSLGAARSSLRARGDASKAAADALQSAGQRLSRVASRLEVGSLVGFVLEARDLSDRLRTQVDSLTEAAEEFATRASALQALADQLEAEGSRVHALFVLTATDAAASEAIDRRFDELLQEQRQLRRRVRNHPSAAGDLAGLIAKANALVPDPATLGTANEAGVVAEQAVALRVRADKSLTDDVLDLEQWRLAWANDAVAVLSTRISDEERAQAYSLSSELFADLRSEAVVAWNRANDGWDQWRESNPGWLEIFTSEAGHRILLRGLGMLLAMILGVLARRRTAHVAVSSVRRLARLPSLRPYLGTIVRWTGLLQTIAPVAILYPVYWTVHALLGPETAIAGLLSAIFLPFFVYQLVRQIVIGSTRDITRGRPALIPLSAETRERLLVTYRRLGLVFAWASMIDGIATVAIGPGRIVSLVDAVGDVWIAIWAGWATLTWRASLARSWQNLVSANEGSREARVARWMASSRLGFVLSPVAAVRTSVAFVTSTVAGRLSGTTLAARLRAMFLRRRSRRAAEDSDTRSGSKVEIPEEYAREFPLYPLLDDKEAVLVPRDSLVGSLCEQIAAWRTSKANGSAVLVGQKGAGKTTLAAMVMNRIDDIEFVTHTLRGTLLTDRDLVRALAAPLGHPDAKTVDELAEALRSGPERVVVIDEAHSAFLRVVGGYRAYDALVSLVNVTSERIFWLLIFNRHTWSFLNASRSRTHYFRRVIMLPDWTSEEIQDLIRRRTSRVGYKLVFGEMLRTNEVGSANELDLIDGSDAYFRLLWESSGGNPRIATCLWLDSLTPVGDKVLEVGLFSEGTPKVLSELGDDLMFALAAVTQRENLSTQELASTINLPLGFAQFAVRYLRESGLFESKDDSTDRVTLAPRYYHQVLRVLRNRHLLLE